MSQNHCDVVIIGSGISALTSAVLLSQKGKKVVVLEQYSRFGGYMHSFRRFGRTFETGAHYVGAMREGQPFHALLNYLDVYQEDLFEPLDESGFDEFYFPEGKVTIPVGYDQVASELGAIFPNEKPAIQKFLKLVQDVVRGFPTYTFNPNADFMAPMQALEMSLQAVVENLTSNPRLQSVLYAYCTLHGVQPQDVAFGLHAIVVDSLITGPAGLRKGGDGLTASFVQKIRANGGELFAKQKVTSLLVKDGQVKEVLTESGQSFSGDWVISTIHPKATFRLLSDQSMMNLAFQNRLTRLNETDGIFGIYAKTNAQIRPFDHRRNYYYFQSSDPHNFLKTRAIDDIPSAAFISVDRHQPTPIPQSMSIHSPGPYAWFSQYQHSSYGKRSLEYIATKTRVADRVFDLIEQFEPNFRHGIADFVSSTPLSNLHFNGSEEGSGYGIYHSIQNTGARALGPRTKVLNLLLAGQNCLFPGLLGASVSALRTCGHIVGIKPILSELLQEMTGVKSHRAPEMRGLE